MRGSESRSRGTEHEGGGKPPCVTFFYSGLQAARFCIVLLIIILGGLVSKAESKHKYTNDDRTSYKECPKVGHWKRTDKIVQHTPAHVTPEGNKGEYVCCFESLYICEITYTAELG